MKNHKGDIKGYVHLKRTWYGQSFIIEGDIVDEVAFGFYSLEGGTGGEIRMRWEKLGGDIVSRLSVYSDGWHVLWELRDVIEKLVAIDGEDITPEEFCKILDKCGFQDQTPVKRGD